LRKIITPIVNHQVFFLKQIMKLVYRTTNILTRKNGDVLGTASLIAGIGFMLVGFALICPENFERTAIEPAGKHPDHNFDGEVCVKELRRTTLVVDNTIPSG